MTWLPAQRAAHLRGARARSPGSASSASASTAIRLTGGEPTGAGPPARAGREARCRPRRVDLSLTTNGATLRARRPRPRATPGCAASTCRLDSLQPERFRELTRRDELDRRARRHRRRPRRRPRPGEGQRASSIRGVNDDEVVDLAAFGREQGRRGPLHRVHAARRQRRRGRNDQVVDPGRDPRARSTRCSRSSPVPARERTRRPSAFRYLDGVGERRRDPQRHRAVLRAVRPHPAHRRGPVPHLPVRPRRARPARDPARRRHRRRPRRRRSRRAVGTKWAGHHINQVRLRPARAGR